MRLHSLTRGEHVKAIGIGAITAILLSTIMVPTFMTGISPLPKPLGLAFAETIFGVDQQPKSAGGGEGPNEQSVAQQTGQPPNQAQSQDQQTTASEQGKKPQQPSGKGGNGPSGQSSKGLPLPVGLLFHAIYVTFWSWAFVVLFRSRLTFLNALMLAVALWAVVLVVIFPIVGWGFFGLGISPKLILASAVPHLLFAVFLWGLCRIGFRRATTEQARRV